MFQYSLRSFTIDLPHQAFLPVLHQGLATCLVVYPPACLVLPPVPLSTASLSGSAVCPVGYLLVRPTHPPFPLASPIGSLSPTFPDCLALPLPHIPSISPETPAISVISMSCYVMDSGIAPAVWVCNPLALKASSQTYVPSVECLSSTAQNDV